MPDGELLTVSQVARRLGLSVATVHEWLRQRRLPKVRLGVRSVRVPAAAIEEIVRAGSVPACRPLPQTVAAPSRSRLPAAVRQCDKQS